MWFIIFLLVLFSVIDVPKQFFPSTHYNNDNETSKALANDESDRIESRQNKLKRASRTLLLFLVLAATFSWLGHLILAPFA